MRRVTIRRSALLLAASALAIGALPSPAPATEVTVQNDSLSGGSLGEIQAGFVAGESAAAWLTSPCDGNVVAAQVFWRSVTGTAPQSLEDSITIFNGGAFPTPGAVLALIEGPVMTDSVINEFRYLDENQTLPLSVPVTNGQVFIVSFKFFNTPNPALGPSVVNDIDGCQAGKNTIDAQGIGWISSCVLGVTGDWVIRAVVECGDLPGACCEAGGTCTDGVTEPACTAAGGAFQGTGTSCASSDCFEACCFMPSGCLDLAVDDCDVAGGFAQGPGTVCGVTVCFPEGACCHADGTCADGLSEFDCNAAGGAFQGDGTLCAGVSCPQPSGACCLSTGNCLLLSQDDCGVIPQSNWAGPMTDCTDGDSNGTADACEVVSVARPMPDASFDIAGTTRACLTDDDCLVGLNPASDVRCVPPPTGDPVPGTCYVRRNRYLSIDPNQANSGTATARRISLDLGGGSTHVLGWLSAPTLLPISGPEATPQLLARIVDAAGRHYRDWAVDDTSAPWVDATLHVGDCETSPGSTYMIQAIAQGADINNEADYSETLVLGTTRDFGDVVGGSVTTPPDQIRNFKDISALTRGFQGAQSEPKVWLDLQGSVATPEVPQFDDINFADINHAVAGFQGGAYPYAVPCDCPGQSCP